MKKTENNTEEGLRVVACPHPLKQESFFYYVTPNQTIDEIIHTIQPDEELAKCVNVWLNDQIVLPEKYKEIIVKENDSLCMRYTLQGGGNGNKLVNTALMVAVMVAAYATGQWWLATYGTTVTTATGTAYTLGSYFTASLIQAGITYAGALAVNALVPVYTGTNSTYSETSAKYSLEASGNQVKKFGSLTVVLGKHKTYPDYAATPYTEKIGEDVYLRMLLNWGYGPLQVEDIKIGDTAITQYNEVEHQFASVYDTKTPFTLYPKDVDQQTIQTALNNANESVVRTTALNTEEVLIDITAPYGFYEIYSSKNYEKGVTRTFTIEYREVGTTEWKKLIMYAHNGAWKDTVVEDGFYTVSLKRKEAFSLGLRYRFDKKGQYDIRITPLENGVVASKKVSQLQWNTLTSLNTDVPIKAKDLCLSAMRIRATEQLNGTITDLTGVVTTICPDWDIATQTWITRPTNNPASLFRYVLQGPFLNRKLSDSQIDINMLQHWHEYCSRNEFECNLVITDFCPLEDILGKIASTGRATTGWIDGKRTVIIDEPKTPKQVVTPRNSWDFSLGKSFMEVPHAWRIPFANEEKEYLTDEYIVYADGYNASNATVFETLSFEGVTKASQIYKMGRYYHNVIKLRPETYTFNMDMENLVCNRGDLMIINHDVPAYGIKTARIKECIFNEDNQCTGVVLDDFIVFEQGRNYYLRNRYSDGSFGVFNITNQYDEGSSEIYTIYFEKPLDSIDIPDNGDLCMLGVTEVETVQVLIKNISPQNDLTATIEAVNYNEAIYETGVVPEFNSNITLAPEYYTNTPKGPDVAISSTVSDESVAIVTIDGSIQPRILVNYYPILPNNNVIVSQYEIQWKFTENPIWNKSVMVDASTLNYYIDGVKEKDSVDIRVRSYAQYKNLPGIVGQPGKWATITVSSVIGTDTVPPDVTKLLIENRHLTWKYPDKPIDFLGFEVRQLGGNIPLWNLGTVISNGLITQTYFDIDNKTYGNQVYMVKAVDKNYNYSKNAAYIITDFGALGVENVKDTIEYNTAWKSGGLILGGVVDPITNWLVSEPAGLFWEGISKDVFWTGLNDGYFWGGSYKNMTYTTIPYTVVANGRLTLTYSIDSIYGYFIEYRKYQEGLADDEDWFAWTNYLDVVKGEQYQFRVSCYQGTRASIIKEFALVNDVPDQIEFFNDLIVPIDGLRIPITKEYSAIKTLTYALQEDGNGGISIIVEDKNAELGPLIRVLNDSSQPVVGLIDVTIYGIPKT